MPSKRCEFHMSRRCANVSRVVIGTTNGFMVGTTLVVRQCSLRVGQRGYICRQAIEAVSEGGAGAAGAAGGAGAASGGAAAFNGKRSRPETATPPPSSVTPLQALQSVEQQFGHEETTAALGSWSLSCRWSYRACVDVLAATVRNWNLNVFAIVEKLGVDAAESIRRAIFNRDGQSQDGNRRTGSNFVCQQVQGPDNMQYTANPMSAVEARKTNRRAHQKSCSGDIPLKDRHGVVIGSHKPLVAPMQNFLDKATKENRIDWTAVGVDLTMQLGMWVDTGGHLDEKCMTLLVTWVLPPAPSETWWLGSASELMTRSSEYHIQVYLS
jgi:hypothetical protein